MACAGCEREGFRHVHVLDSPEAVEAATIERTPLWNNRTDEHGPFDIIGDVHGCCDELEQLLAELGYELAEQREGEFPDGGPVYTHPDGRKAVFVGDLVDRGPRILDTVRLGPQRWSRRARRSACPGNHDMKLVRKLRGRDVQITHGLDRCARRDRRAARRAPRCGGRRGRAVPRLRSSATTSSTTASSWSRTPA